MPAAKRKAADSDMDEPSGKKAKVAAQVSGLSGSGPSDVPAQEPVSSEETSIAPPNQTTENLNEKSSAMDSEKKRRKRKATGSPPEETKTASAKYRKLAPPRPFPTVPTSVSATGPRSAHVEGKNYICITRKTPLGAYLRRCKDVVLKAGYVFTSCEVILTTLMILRHKTLHLHAMGAAIPHLLQLSLSLPEILPYAPEEIHTEVLTGTVDVQDEVIPEDEDEDISIRTRGKSTLSVVIKIGDGKDEGAHTGKGQKKVRNGATTPNHTGRNARQNKQGDRKKGGKGGERRGSEVVPEQVVIRAEDVEE